MGILCVGVQGSCTGAVSAQAFSFVIYGGGRYSVRVACKPKCQMLHVKSWFPDCSCLCYVRLRSCISRHANKECLQSRAQQPSVKLNAGQLRRSTRRTGRAMTALSQYALGQLDTDFRRSTAYEDDSAAVESALSVLVEVAVRE